MTAWVKVVLFASSYAPLWLIFLVQSLNHITLRWPPTGVPCIAYGFFALLVGPTVALAYVFREAQAYSPRTIEVRKWDPKNSEALNYIVTYVIPFLSIDFQSVSDLIAICVLVLVLGTLYVNSNLIYTNPVLRWIGYSIFYIETTQDDVIILITRRRRIRRKDVLKAVILADNVYLEVCGSAEPGTNNEHSGGY